MKNELEINKIIDKAVESGNYKIFANKKAFLDYIKKEKNNGHEWIPRNYN